MKLFTIGFTKKSARRFFDLLRESGVKRILDVRINNGSQLAGFAKKDDLAYFLEEICGMDYVHLPSLAPRRSCCASIDQGSWTGRLMKPASLN